MNSESKKNLNLVLTYRCNFTCRHCISNCGPSRDETMTADTARRYIDRAAEVLQLNSIGFTGGEPFLVYPLLKELLEYAYSKYGLPGGTVTNCFWAKNPQIAEQKIAELYECGLRTIVVSLDSFHLDYVALENIKNVAQAALKQGLLLTVNTVVTRSGKISKSNAAALLSLDKKYFEENRVVLKEFGPLKIGRAKESLLPGDYIETEQELLFNGNCPFIITTPSLAPDGNVYACCCFGDSTKNPKQLIAYCGNVHEDDLGKILLSMENNLLFNIFRVKGPYSLLKMLLQTNPDLPVRGKYLSNCDICVELYHNESVKKKLHKLLLMMTADAGGLND